MHAYLLGQILQIAPVDVDWSTYIFMLALVVLCFICMIKRVPVFGAPVGIITVGVAAWQIGSTQLPDLFSIVAALFGIMALFANIAEAWG